MEFDSFTKTGATRLASKIALYWTTRGLSGVQTWLEVVPLRSDAATGRLYQVRSNIGELLRGARHSNSDPLLRGTGIRTVH